MNIEESIYKQKSRNLWLRLGDSNTAFIYACMRNRISKNKIRTLVTAGGTMVHTEQDIEEEILGFYKELLGSSATSLPAINPGVMKEGKVLSRAQQLGLLDPFTKEGVYTALSGIDDLKAPGCDGFNYHLFKKAWSVIGDDITVSILQFFEMSKMHKPISVTSHLDT